MTESVESLRDQAEKVLDEWRAYIEKIKPLEELNQRRLAAALRKLEKLGIVIR